MPTQYPLRVSASKPAETIKVLVGPVSRSQPYLLPERQLCFYSPYLRALIGKAQSWAVCLPEDDPKAFEVLVSWMNYEPGAPCHQRGVALEKKIEVVDNNGVPLVFKVWSLAHRLGGPCLVLRDECMRYLYETYTKPSAGTGIDTIGPAILKHAFSKVNQGEQLRHFVLACVVQAGPPDQNDTALTRCWEAVLDQIPRLRATLWKAWSAPEKGHIDTLLSMEVYMGALGEIFGDVVAQESAPGWIYKDVGEEKS